MASSCLQHPYMIPRLYVEGVKSSEYLVAYNHDYLEAAGTCPAKAKCYGKVIYGSYNGIYDLIEKKAVRSFIVVFPPAYSEGIVVEEGTHLEPIPVEGVRVALEVCEGKSVSIGDTIALVATRKREVRRIRSHVDGIVVYVYSSPTGGIERDIVFIAPREAVRNVRVAVGERG
ncbi:MAG: DUF2118 domain-containing protein [Hyperthermus sp.]|nr:MAG: DUF2118 domain-containing protein [Hyperthermus sp.]